MSCVKLYKYPPDTQHAAWLMGKASGHVQVHFSDQVPFAPRLQFSFVEKDTCFFEAGQPKPQQIEVEFKFQSPTLITGLDFGNFWSARCLSLCHLPRS